MNNLKKLKLLVASALLSSTAVYADDCTDPSARNCGITISGNQTIDIDSSISTTDEKGIYISNGSNTLTIDGNITTTSSVDRATGINIHSVNATNNVINMTGGITTISVDGAERSKGILLSGGANNNTVNVTGPLSTSGNYGTGIAINTGTSHNNVTLTGDMNITGSTDSYGVSIFGQVGDLSSDNVITVNGNINTVSISIFAGDYVTDNNIVVNGNVQSSGRSAIRVSGAGSTNNVVVVNGNLTTTATSESPTIQIFNQTTDNLIIIDGNVTQLANQAAVSFGSAGGTTSNDNTISITGQITSAQDGIVFSRSDHNEVFVSGGIDAVRNAISADSNSDNNIVYLDRNARIEGAIVNNGTNNTLIFTGWQPIDGDGNTDIDGDVDLDEVISSQSQYGLATSSNYTVSGTTPWVIRANVAQPVLVSNTYVKTMGVANIDDEGNRLYLRTTKINQNLTERTRAYALNEVEPYWMNVYTTKSERDKDFEEIHQNARGVTIGGQLSQFNKPIDLIFNLENSDASYGLSTQHIESNSVMAGALIPKIANLFDGDLSAKVLVGMSDNDTKRTVLNNLVDGGTEKVTGDYDSTYLVVGAEWLKTVLTKGNTNNDMVLGLDFSQEYIDSYSESKYYHLDSRDISQVTARAEYGMTYHEKDSPFTANTRFGVAHRQMVAGEKQDYQIDGISTSFKGDEDNTYFNVGMGVDYQLTNGIKAYVAGNFMDSSDEIHSVSGSFGVMGSF
ncbi:hypothetical protein OAR80_02760 [Methylophilaceae bacterium]|nr:hypothetical protein [Methylophilaceae bacterium]